jgi:hypothetical protein
MRKICDLFSTLRIFILSTGVVLSGCSSPSIDRGAAQNPSDNSEKQAIGLPVEFPAPPDTSANLSDTNIIGGGSRWFGRLSLTSRATTQEAYRFYGSSMAQSGWEQISSSISENMVQIFINRSEGRSCVITIAPRTALKGSHINISVAPLDNNITQTK